VTQRTMCDIGGGDAQNAIGRRRDIEAERLGDA
jgi:hypothetical protein